MITLSDLRKRVEEAQGPEFSLECDICAALEPVRIAHGLPMPSYTASIGAALCLVERVRPMWMITMELSPHGCGVEFQHPDDDKTFFLADRPDRHLPLAVLAALLAALEAGERNA